MFSYPVVFTNLITNVKKGKQTMKIKVNYYYNQKYLPTKRHRNERERQIADTLEINLRELSSDMFPIAFIVHDIKSVYQGAKSYDDFVDDKYDGYKTFPEEIRAYNGELYMPIRITHGAAVSTEFEDENSLSIILKECSVKIGIVEMMSLRKNQSLPVIQKTIARKTSEKPQRVISIAMESFGDLATSRDMLSIPSGLVIITAEQDFSLNTITIRTFRTQIILTHCSETKPLHTEKQLQQGVEIPNLLTVWEKMTTSKF